MSGHRQKVARITFDGGQSREWRIFGSAHVEAVVEAAEFNELAALEPAGTGPAVTGVPYPRRRGRLGGLIAGVLSASCQECAAPPGCGCDPASPVIAEMVRMAVAATRRRPASRLHGRASPGSGRSSPAPVLN